MTHAPRDHRRRARARRRWRPGALLWVTALAAVAAASTLAYSPAASWLAAYNQSQIVADYADSLAHLTPEPAEQIVAARAYNDALSSGALLDANANVPVGDGASAGFALDYADLLATPSGVMSRIQIPSIDVDLPVFHGTSEQTLMRGAGHLQGTSLPVGGIDGHSVITAHRGLAQATMFTRLDEVRIGDMFTLTTVGEVFSYRVVDTRVVAPDDTATIRPEAGRDLVTLVTCTPLGINSHRILVTGERVLPVPDTQLRLADSPPEVGFPWWLVLYLAALAAIGVYLWRAGWVPARSARDEVG